MADAEREAQNRSRPHDGRKGVQLQASDREQRRSSVAGLTEYPTDSVHEEWQVGDTVQLRTEPFEL